MRGSAPAVLTRRPRGDDGTILLLSIGFCAVALLLVWAVVDASVVFLARRDLAAAVDGTALAAARQVDVDRVYASGARGDLPLQAGAVRSAVQDYVARTYPLVSYPEQRIVGDVTADQHAVAVSGRRTVHLPVFGSVTVTAHATAVTHSLE
ncbi:MAG TPA: pilus assembly protein TadG-related protein [Mycobacteriales bacterium]|nr:pilus assembly protein TadG-related protein [Mycobacteriales bacterium]